MQIMSINQICHQKARTVKTKRQKVNSVHRRFIKSSEQATLFRSVSFHQMEYFSHPRSGCQQQKRAELISHLSEGHWFLHLQTALFSVFTCFNDRFRLFWRERDLCGYFVNDEHWINPNLERNSVREKKKKMAVTMSWTGWKTEH